MTFRNDAQRGMVAKVLTDRLGKGPMFVLDEYGVTRPTAGLSTHRKKCFATYEVFFVRLAWDVWNGSGKASMDVAITNLDSTNLQMVGELLSAIATSGHWMLDGWILEWMPVQR